jgi:tetratricopeptide (TPR) repeat protein
MAETAASVPKRAQDLFNKGFTALERGNVDYAVDMLFEAVKLAPDFAQARKFLRAAEVRRAQRRKPNPVADVLNEIKSLPQRWNVLRMLKAGHGRQAVLAVEKLLRTAPLKRANIMLFGKAAAAAGLVEAAAETMEIGREQNPDDVGILSALGSLYQAMGRTRYARACFERLSELRPRDPAALKQLKDAMALDSMSTDGWNAASDGGGTFRDMIRDGDEAVLLEKQSKAVKSEQDAGELIRETKAKIEAEPGNMNYYRALARLYVQNRQFDDAIATLEQAIGISPGDPELDRALSTARTQQFDHRIAAVRAEGKEDEAVRMEGERNQFIFDDLQERVKRYPNDLRLRFELGEILFKNDYVTEAIQQLQLAQRNPKDRILALYYLGMCFKAKRQYDLAVEQLEKALGELPTMNDSKKDVLYELGCIAELSGDAEKATQYFKQIYQADIGYRDVAAKVEQAYDS